MLQTKNVKIIIVHTSIDYYVLRNVTSIGSQCFVDIPSIEYH